MPGSSAQYLNVEGKRIQVRVSPFGGPGEYRLIAARDADRVDRARPRAARVRAEKARDRARLRLQPLRRAFGFSQRPAPLRLYLPRFGVALFGHQSFALGGNERLGGPGSGLSARRVFGLLKTRRAERAAGPDGEGRHPDRKGMAADPGPADALGCV